VIGPGAVLDDRYEVLELLAQGGMADVYRARDRRLDREVAVKAFRLGAADVRRFQAETKILAGFDHRNLVRVLDAGSLGDQPYVVLELVAGPTLAHRLSAGPLPDGEVRDLGADIAAALDHVHSARVVHRDVKPSNILLTPDGRALLGDFGIALLLDATRLTGTAQTPGTAAYLAPEQVSGGDVTPAADIYSLGLVLLEALTGRRPFHGTAQEMMAARLARTPPVPPELPERWPALLTSMTAVDPAARPTAATVHGHLAKPDLAATLAAPPPPAPPPAGWPAGIPGGAETAATQEQPMIAERTEILGPGLPERATPRRRLAGWLAGVAAIAIVLLAVAVSGLAGDDSKNQPPPAATTSTEPAPSTTVAPVAPATSASTLTACAQFETTKQSIEAEKQRIESQYRDDKATRERLKNELEAQKKEIEAQKRAAKC
jgi:eukaryotic-like serine/threonine-protein kinase